MHVDVLLLVKLLSCTDILQKDGAPAAPINWAFVALTARTYYSRTDGYRDLPQFCCASVGCGDQQKAYDVKSTLPPAKVLFDV